MFALLEMMSSRMVYEHISLVYFWGEKKKSKLLQVEAFMKSLDFSDLSASLIILIMIFEFFFFYHDLMSVSTMSSSLKHNNKSASGEDLKVGTLFFFFFTVLNVSLICRYVQGD